MWLVGKRGWPALGLLLGLAACGGTGAPQVVDGPEPTGQSTAALGGTVQDAVGSGCSTIAVIGLSKQIVDEVNCVIPSALAAVPDKPNLVKSATTFAFMQPPAKDALVAALDGNTGMTLNVDSMLRTVAQQYLLYAWYKAGSCGIQLAATPGTSNHEQGLAFDTPDYNAWMGTLQSQSFHWFGSADVVHFDFVGNGIVDLNGKDVLAFQKLWNLNHPTDTISEDGQYGPQTESRLQQSPADGFPTGASCGGPPPPPPPDAGPPTTDGGHPPPPPMGDAGSMHSSGDGGGPAPGGEGGARPGPAGMGEDGGAGVGAAPSSLSSGCSLAGGSPGGGNAPPGAVLLGGLVAFVIGARPRTRSRRKPRLPDNPL